jgi:hypothetical protein
MHGTIFVELQKYVETKLGPPAWPTLLEKAGITHEPYDVMKAYPDQEVLALVSTASKITGTPVPSLLEDFGEFIAPDLLDLYWGVVRPEWKTLDVIEHTEEVIHRVVRLQNPGARPPELRCERRDRDHIVITYTSERRLCAIAKGIARGLARHYGEEIAIAESRCMLSGADRCEISVRTVPVRDAQP